MKYVLAGFAAPTAKGPTFLIPMFAKRGSNGAYVQQLRADYSIEEFLPFDATEVPRTFPPERKIQLEAGDDGVLAFLDSNDVVFSGSAAALAAYLSSEHASLSATPFLALEVARFLGNDRAIAHAIENAAKQFKNIDAAKMWSQTELVARSAARRDATPEAELKAILLQLEQIDDAPQWHHLWQRGWRKFPRNRDLERAAIVWTRKTASNDRTASVLSLLLRTEPASSDVQTAARDWLEPRHPSKAWARVFAALTPYLSGPADSTIVRALRIVNDAEQLDGAVQWARIWLTLRTKLGRSSDLFHAARRALPRLRGERALRVFKRCTQDFPGECEPVLVLTEWFPRKEMRRELWADIFLYFSSFDRVDDRITSLGADWIFETDPRTENWDDVWYQLVAIRPSEELYDLANEWVATVPPSSAGWIGVMNTLLRARRASNQTRLLALRWIETNSRSIFANRMKQLLEDSE